jgi:hypothetical protein
LADLRIEIPISGKPEIGGRRHRKSAIADLRIEMPISGKPEIGGRSSFEGRFAAVSG